MTDPTYKYPPAQDPGPINDSRYKSLPLVEDENGVFHNISLAAPMPTRRVPDVEMAKLLELMEKQLLLLGKIELHLAQASGDFNLTEKDVHL